MDETEKQLADYQATLGYFHALHDVRFKLLGLLPVLSGVALVFVPRTFSPWQQLSASFLGLIVIAGLASYDQRNTQIYDRLVKRAKFLEKKLGFPPLPGDEGGGAFHSRPPLGRWKLVWHIQGLTLVYAACLSAWAYLGIAVAVSSPILAAKLGVGAFGVSYIALRFVSALHHQPRLKFWRWPSTGYVGGGSEPPAALPPGDGAA